MFNPRNLPMTPEQLTWLFDTMSIDFTTWKRDPEGTAQISYMESSELRIQLQYIGINNQYRVTTW